MSIDAMVGDGSGGGTGALLPDCANGQILEYDTVNGWVCVAKPGGGGDNLGNHIATATLDMQTHPIRFGGTSITSGLTGGGGIWTKDSSDNVFYTGGNVGIKTNSPENTLHVEGTPRFTRSGKYLFFDPNDGDANQTAEIISDTGMGLEIQVNGGAGSEGIWIEPNGNVGIGTGSPSERLDVNGNVRANAYYHSSDRRLKKNVRTISGLDLVEKLRGVSFDWKDSGDASAGVIAQEVEKILPSAVKENADGIKSVEYDQLIAPLIEAMKELKAENDALRARLEKLEAQ
jgi:hypothetical protein